MYWSDWGTVGRIESASMDGSNRTVIHNTSLIWPNALTLDIPTQLLYWADANLRKVESSSVDGTNRMILAQEGVQHPFGIVISDNTVYFSDWIVNYIRYINNSTIAGLHDLDYACNRIYGIQIVTSLKQPIGKLHTLHRLYKS